MSEPHSTHTDALATLGTIISPTEKRDAIHLAVFPTSAGQTLRPGEHVKLINGAAWLARPGDGDGIVDPFLVVLVEPGQRFWLVVYPRQITSLRHVWEHPAFPASGETDSCSVDLPDERAISELWLREFSQKVDVPSFEWMVDAAARDPEYMISHGEDASGAIPPEFWTHVETYTGQTIGPDRAEYFSCSC